jgi:ribosomal protein S7
MGCNYGSMWRKWDFHVHTPYSILNNNYGFNPFEMDESKLEVAFDDFVKKLFTEAVANNIAAIGITDYFMIEGYKRIKNKYLLSPEKMQECFPNEELRRKVESIYVFPNIELRLDTFVGEGASSVNYHVIFSNSVLEREIEQNFLNQLEFKHDAGGRRPLTLDNIEEFGRTIKANNGNSGSDLKVGLEHVTVGYDTILEVLRKNPSFAGTYMIAIPVDEDLSQIQWNGRDYQTRRNLYKQAHIFLTSNQRTAKWALAEGEEENRIREFGSIKPCIWGSDAHEYERLFKPACNNYCWLKSEPSFEGLMQIIYEPGARVRIQNNRPCEKDSHQLIDSITFSDENFQQDPVVFNDSLTCIIGGKSTGKSLLLRQLASAIDSKYVEEQERTALHSRKPFNVKPATVLWKDGTTGERKIVYIPQTYLNKTIDNPEESTAITRIIEDVLLQESDIQTAHEVFRDKLERIKRKTHADIQSLTDVLQKLKGVEEDIKREGTSATFTETIKVLETQRADLAEKVNVSQEEIERFGELEKLIQGSNTTIAALTEELNKLAEINPPVVVIPGYFQSADGFGIEHYFGENFPKSESAILTLIDMITGNITSLWHPAIDEIKAKIALEIDNHKKTLAQYQTEYDGLKGKVAQSEQLQKITVRIADEGTKLQDALTRESKRDSHKNKISELRTNILKSQSDYLTAYEEYARVVCTTGTQKDTELIFEAKVVWKRAPFVLSLSNMFNNKNYSPFRSKYSFDLAELQDTDYGTDLLESIWNAMDNPNEYGGITVKGGYTVEKVLQQLFEDWYNIHYVVKSGNDTIEEMSPGKKALVLLELLISLEDSKCPILIDQPEDDLDNRSIYYDLVQFIRRRKEERQIIIVTHNANVVLGADAEEVIIANQNGKDTENFSARFEYRSGAIENDEVLKDEAGEVLAGILNKSGIQTQICDILEGGKTAFQLRQNKYAVIAQ